MRTRLLFALLVAAALVAAAGAALGRPQPAAAERSTTLRESTCVGEITGTVSMATARMCDTPVVTTHVEPLCPVCPGGLNVIFIQLTMAPQHGWQNQEAVRVLDEIERYAEQVDPANLNLAVIQYDGTDATIRQRFTDNFDSVRGALRRPQNGYIPRGDAEKAAQLAVRELDRVRRQSSGDDPCEVVVMFAHVKEHDSHAANLDRAGAIIRRENVLFVVGCPIDSGAWYCEGPEPRMPKSRRFYAKYAETGKLQQVVRREMQNFPGDVKLRELTLVQTVPSGLSVLPGSMSLAPAEVFTEAEGTRYTWRWTDADASQPQTVTYRVQPQATGRYVIPSAMKLVDTIWAERELALDAPPVVAVLEECPVPPTETPTATPTATATRTPTPTRTPTVTPTATPGVYRIYLPILHRETCADRRRHADIALVLDMSTSMQRLTRDGRPKVAAVQDAARAFVARMRFTPDEHGDYDQVAVVGFNREAWIEQSLTNDPARLEAAIGVLPERMREFTRLDLAIERGAEALRDPKVRDDSARILVLLTDGLPNQVPYDPVDGTMETTVLKAATAAKAEGVRLYTVGVGQPDGPDLADRINADLLRAAASSPALFYQTLDAEDLAAIYEEIATNLGCVKLPSLR